MIIELKGYNDPNELCALTMEQLKAYNPAYLLHPKQPAHHSQGQDVPVFKIVSDGLPQARAKLGNQQAGIGVSLQVLPGFLCQLRLEASRDISPGEASRLASLCGGNLGLMQGEGPGL